MKKSFLTLSIFVIAITLFCSCAQEKQIQYVQLNRYFLKNNVDSTQLVNPTIVDSKEKFESLFGATRVMSADGGATPVDFDKQFVIATIKPTTSLETTLAPISLTKEGSLLTFKYSISEGKNQSFVTRPILLIAVPKEFKTEVKLDESKI